MYKFTAFTYWVCCLVKLVKLFVLLPLRWIKMNIIWTMYRLPVAVTCWIVHECWLLVMFGLNSDFYWTSVDSDSDAEDSDLDADLLDSTASLLLSVANHIGPWPPKCLGRVFYTRLWTCALARIVNLLFFTSNRVQGPDFQNFLRRS